MNELPAAFLDEMEKMLGSDFPAFLKTYGEEPCRALRTRSGLLPAEAGKPVQWYKGGVYLPQDSAAGAGILHEAGAWYLQEASAMIPAAVLPLETGDRVLDLCAAPGGKTTQLAERMRDGLLVANEIVPSRAEILSSNVERMGCRNTVVTSADPALLAEKWPGFFDRVLVDAPCSGEGMFRRHPETRDEWTKDSPAMCAARQRTILAAAVQLLRPGGMLVYSTCTFNETENEETVRWLTEAFPAFSLCPFTLPGIDAPEGMTHIFPHCVRGEGHFVALLRKAEEPARETAQSARPLRRAAKGRPEKPAVQPLTAEQQKLWQQFARETLAEEITADGLFGGCAVHLPPVLPPLDGIRVLRCGVRLGEFRGKVFVPDHALSHAVRFAKYAELTAEQAEQYMRGESFALDAPFTGFGAAVYKGCRLGLCKMTNGMLKNHYPKGLRKNLTAD